MKSEEIEIDGTQYVVKEMSMREVLPLMEEDPKNLAVEMLKVCVEVGGVPVGDPILDLGFGAFQKILTTSNLINGITVEGND